MAEQNTDRRPCALSGKKLQSTIGLMDLEGRMGRTERRLDATLKIVQTGMKMLVKMQQESREFKNEMRDFKKETQRGINTLIAAQMRTYTKLDRLVDVLLRTHSNGRTN
jgi:adenylate kinase